MFVAIETAHLHAAITYIHTRIFVSVRGVLPVVFHHLLPPGSDSVGFYAAALNIPTAVYSLSVDRPWCEVSRSGTGVYYRTQVADVERHDGIC